MVSLLVLPNSLKLILIFTLNVTLQCNREISFDSMKVWKTLLPMTMTMIKLITSCDGPVYSALFYRVEELGSNLQIRKFLLLPLSLTKHFRLFQMKQFADNFKFVENGRQLSKQVENTVGKSSFPTLSSKVLYSRHVKTRACLGKD